MQHKHYIENICMDNMKVYNYLSISYIFFSFHPWISNPNVIVSDCIIWLIILAECKWNVALSENNMESTMLRLGMWHHQNRLCFQLIYHKMICCSTDPQENSWELSPTVWHVLWAKTDTIAKMGYTLWGYQKESIEMVGWVNKLQTWRVYIFSKKWLKIDLNQDGKCIRPSIRLNKYLRKRIMNHNCEHWWTRKKLIKFTKN